MQKKKKEVGLLPDMYQINLSDFALFLSVMKVKSAYEDVLSIILNETDLKLKEVKVEQVVLNKSGKRAIRLDAWAQDEQDRQSEEWEDAEMNIYEMGMEQGSLRALIRYVDSAMKNFHLSLQEACAGLEISVEEYEEAKRQIAPRKEKTNY